MMEIKPTAKCVTNWWLQKLPNGIYNLTINTTEKWMGFHAYNDNTFIIGSKENESQAEWEDKQLIIPEFLPKLENGVWIQTVQENKDQISVYWMAYDFDWIKNRQEQLVDKMENYK